MSVSMEELINVCVEVNAKVDSSSIKPDTCFSASGLDSLDLFQVIAQLEEKYNFSMPNEDYYQIKTFQELESYINNTLSGQG